MIYTHTVQRALRFYTQHAALASGEKRFTFQELHERVAGVAVTLANHGFGRGDRLAILLPNEPEYIELIYACSRLGLIAVPLNTRLSPNEIDRVLVDASPQGSIREEDSARALLDAPKGGSRLINGVSAGLRHVQRSRLVN